MKHNFLSTVFFEGHFVPFEQAKISIATHGFQYGTGAFGGLRGFVCENKKEVILFRLQDHAKRLANAAKYLGHKLDHQIIASKIIEFVNANQPQVNFYIRPMVYLSSLGIVPKLHENEIDFLIYGLELGEYLNHKGVSCRFSSWIRQQDQAVPLRGKLTGSYTMASMAKTEAVESGFDEALVLNSTGKVCEGSAMNLFIVRNGKLITPGFNEDILEGITRDSIIHIAKDEGIEVINRPIDKSEIIIADEVFLTGTAGRVTPVYRIENYDLPQQHPICDKLAEIFKSVVEGKNPKYENWLTKVTLN
jgi:branched-chain amino acid aminotransferase